MKNTVRQLIRDKYPAERTEEIIDELVSGKYTHDFPITAEQAGKLLGECVETELPREVYTLMGLYRMETRPQRPSVEFVPISTT